MMSNEDEDPLCPPNFWEDEASHSERVLLVVHIDKFHDVKRIAEQISWIGNNVFPFSVFRERRLVLVGERVQIVNHTLDAPWDWEPFEDWGDLYCKLLSGGYFVQLPPAQQYFHAALFLNVREDATAGCGYALPEVRSERCLLRAMFLASQGNLLFGDWGYALGYSPKVTHDDLIRTTILPTYIYENVSFQWYPGDVRGGRALLLFLPHYLRPQFASKDALTLRTMETVRKMVNGTLFDAYTRKLARWNAYWWLYFADDGKMREHQWVIGQQVHYSLIENYVAFRLWVGSSSYKAIATDVVVFLLLGPCLFALVEYWIPVALDRALIFSCRWYEPTPAALTHALDWIEKWREPIPTAFFRGLAWFCGWQLVFFPLWPFTRLMSLRELMKWIVHRSLIFLALDPLFKIWWSRFDYANAIIALALYFVIALMDKLSGKIILVDDERRNMVSVLLTSPILFFDARMDRALYFLVEQLVVWFPLLAIVYYKIGSHQRFFFATQENIRSWVAIPALTVLGGSFCKWFLYYK